MKLVLASLLICFSFFPAHAEEELFNNYAGGATKGTDGEDLFADDSPGLSPTKRFKAASKKKRSTASVKVKRKAGNLPSHQIPAKGLKKYVGAVTIRPDKPAKQFLENIRVGEHLIVDVDQRLIGFPGSKIPVNAEIPNGKFKGSILFGTSSMSETTKRLLLNFTILTLPNGTEYAIDADLLSPDGTLGLNGEIFSNKAELFGLDLIFNAFKGYSEASKDRNTTVLGAEYTINNVKNAEKGAVSEASKASVDRIRNEFLKVDEFVSTNRVERGLVILKSKPYKQ